MCHREVILVLLTRRGSFVRPSGQAGTNQRECGKESNQPPTTAGDQTNRRRGRRRGHGGRCEVGDDARTHARTYLDAGRGGGGRGSRLGAEGAVLAAARGRAGAGPAAVVQGRRGAAPRAAPPLLLLLLLLLVLLRRRRVGPSDRLVAALLYPNGPTAPTAQEGEEGP